jgi:hypothetical protein
MYIEINLFLHFSLELKDELLLNNSFAMKIILTLWEKEKFIIIISQTYFYAT